jgi:hypothetical protein
VKVVNGKGNPRESNHKKLKGPTPPTIESIII